MYYATLYQAKQHLGLLSETTEDARLTQYLKWATGLINAYKMRRYDVRLVTIPHDAPLSMASTFGRFDSSYAVPSAQKSLILLDDLLEMMQFLNGDGTEIAADAYLLEPFERTPYSVARLRSGTTWSLDDNGDASGALSLKGFWGYHPDYDNAWIDSLDSVRDNPLTAGATTIHVADVNGMTEDLESPRFQAGQLLRIEDDLALVLSASAVTGNDDVLTVKRGVNGATAVQHVLGKTIKIFRPDPAIVQVCLRLVHWRFVQKDSDTFDRAYAVGTGVVSSPASLPADVRDILGAKGRPRR